MAFENIDKQALAEMANDYDIRTTPSKPGFWFNLFSNSDSSKSTSSAKEQKHLNNEYDYVLNEHIAPNECAETLGPFIKYDPNYSPMVGGNDWDW